MSLFIFIANFHYSFYYLLFLTTIKTVYFLFYYFVLIFLSLPRVFAFLLILSSFWILALIFNKEHKDKASWFM